MSMKECRVIVIAGLALSLAAGVAKAAASTPALSGSVTSQAIQMPPTAAGSVKRSGNGASIPAASPLPIGNVQPAGAEPIQPGEQLTLKRAIMIALKYHPRIKEAASNSAAARERVGEARAFLGPQLFGVSQYLRSTDNGIGNTSYYDSAATFPRMTGRNHDLPANDFGQSWGTDNNYMGGVALSQFLFDFGRRHGLVTERRFEAKAVTADQQFTDLNLILEVSQRYFRLLEASQLVKVYEKAVEQRKYHLHEAMVKARAGLRPQLDVYVTEAEVQRAQLRLVEARNDQADAKVALDNALGLSGSTPEYKLSDVLAYSPIHDTFGSLILAAYRYRPDLLMLEDQARAMGARVVQYRSDYYPTVNAVAGYAGMGTGLPVANNFNVGLVITWPIFNSFLTTHQVAEAKFREQSVQHAIEDLRQRIILQVKTALLNWQASLERIQRARKALVASRAELELAEQRYQAGLTNIVELEDAQRHYTYDDAQYADALYEFSVAKAVVDHATARALRL
jgi:outer membrane protein